jgi:hypothetical protein
MTFALAERRAGRWPGLDIETLPPLLAFVSILPGRLLLVAVCAALMRPMVPLWPAMALTAVAMSVFARRHASVVTAAATVLVFLLSPNWYQHDTLAAGLREAGPFDPRRGLIDWAAPALIAAVFLGFLAAVRAGGRGGSRPIRRSRCSSVFSPCLRSRRPALRTRRHGAGSGV